MTNDGSTFPRFDVNVPTPEGAAVSCDIEADAKLIFDNWNARFGYKRDWATHPDEDVRAVRGRDWWRAIVRNKGE